MAHRNGRHPSVLTGHVSAFIAGTLSFAELLYVGYTGSQRHGGTQIEDPRAAALRFGIDAVDGHAGAHHIEEGFSALKKPKAGAGVRAAQSDSLLFQRMVESRA